VNDQTEIVLSPLHTEHEALGASMTPFAGWMMPLRYAGDLAEHRAVREAAGLFDLSHMGELHLDGPQAAAALDHALVGNLTALAVGRAQRADGHPGRGAAIRTVRLACARTQHVPASLPGRLQPVFGCIHGSNIGKNPRFSNEDIAMQQGRKVLERVMHF
jgi:hypothetical protein